MVEPDSRDLIVPGDGLVVLIGPAGSGKSTLARATFAEDAILSSDAFRARLGRGEADQSVTAAAFAALHRELDDRMSAGLLTVVDATSLTRGARRTLIRSAQRWNRLAIALVLDLPPEVVIARNAGRGERVVPEPAVRRQLAMLGALTDEGLRREGFSTVRRLGSPVEVESLRVTID
ncbi:MAG: AAA family ATPase [Chloroflexota bacterium]